jgi:hypothetical protein
LQQDSPLSHRPLFCLSQILEQVQRQKKEEMARRALERQLKAEEKREKAEQMKRMQVGLLSGSLSSSFARDKQGGVTLAVSSIAWPCRLTSVSDVLFFLSFSSSSSHVWIFPFVLQDLF